MTETSLKYGFFNSIKTQQLKT